MPAKQGAKVNIFFKY